MKLKNKYFLLRHGQTVYQKDEDKKYFLYPSPENPPIELTEEGKKQIEVNRQRAALCRFY